MLERDRRGPEHGGEDAESESSLEPGKASLTEQLGKRHRVQSQVPGRSMRTDALPPPKGDLLGKRTAAAGSPHQIQRKANGERSAANPREAAESGTQGAGERLPHFDRVQRSFGSFDISGVRAYVGGAAAEANRELGAQAYAHGDSVAFASSPDLHTTAHEAAHVVQQRGGVQLEGGIDGGASDPYEQHADAVADAVVAGRSAEPLLEQPHGSAGAERVVQRKTEAEPFVATSGDMTGGILGTDAQKWMSTWGEALSLALSTYLQNTNFLMPTPFADWKSGSSKAFAEAMFAPFTKLGKTQHYSQLGAVLAPDRLDPLINAGRDAPTAEKEDPYGAPIHPKGTFFYQDGVKLEIGKFLVKRVIESLARVMPRWLHARNQLALSSEGPAKTPDRDPRTEEVVASHPMDRFVIAGLANHVTMNFKAYRLANPDETVLGDMRLGELRTVNYEWQHDQGMWNWLRVTYPEKPTKEEVAKTLYGDETYAHTITDASPLFGIVDTDNMLLDVRSHWYKLGGVARQPARLGDDPQIDAPEQQVQHWGLVPEEVMLAQSAEVQPTKNLQPNEDGRKVILDRMNGGMQLYQQIFKQSEQMPAGGYDTLLDESFKRLQKRAEKVADPNTPMSMVIPYDGQTQSQFDLLTKALNGITIAIKQYKTFEKWPNSRLATQQVGWLYLKVACLSEQRVAATEQLATADQQSKLFPVTIMELLLAELRKVLHTESGKKHGDEAKWDTDAKHDERTDLAAHTQREAKLREGLARVRDKLLQGQDGADEDLKALAKELTDLQNEVSIVADLDAMEVAWKALYNDISYVGVISGTNKKDLKKINGENGLRQLHDEWTKIYARYKSGDKEGAINELKEKRPTWTKLYDDIGQLIEDNETRNKWVTFALLVGIAVITAGIGAYVEGAAAAAWGATSWATFAVTTGAEAVAFTSMSYLIVEKEPTIGGFFIELGKNLLMFGALKGLTGKYVEWIGKDVAGTADTMIVQFVALNTAALVEADVKKYLVTGQHLSFDEVLEISKQNALFMVAAGMATMAAKPGLESLKLQGEADVALLRLRNTKADLRNLAAEIESSKNVDWSKGQDLLAKQRELLAVEEEALQRLEKIASDEKAAKKAGIDAKMKDDLLAARKQHDQLANAMKLARAIALTEGSGSIRYAAKGAEFDEVVEAWRTKETSGDGTKVVDVVTDKMFGARGVEVTTADGESFRIIERTTANEEALAKSPQLGQKAPTAEEAAQNKAVIAELEKLFEQRTVETEQMFDGMGAVHVKRLQVGGDAAGVFNQASMPAAGGTGAKAGSTAPPDFVTISDGKQVWLERGPVNQMPGEVVGPGVDPSKLTPDQHAYVDPKDLAAAIMEGKYRSGMALYRGRAVGSIETQGKHPHDKPWEVPEAKLRIWIEKPGGKGRYWYADAIDLATGPGPSAEMPDAAVKGGLDGEGYQAMRGDNRIFYGDQAPTQVVPGAKKVVVWGGSGNAAAMAEFFAKQGCDVTWVARKSSKGINPHFKPEYDAIVKELKRNPPKELRAELEARKATLEAYSFAMLPRNVYEAFESPVAKDKIHREIGDLGKIEEAVDKDGNKQVKLEINGKVVLVDQLIVSLGQEPATPGAAASLTKGLELRMILNADGRLVGLESVDPPGAVRLMGAAFADMKMAEYVVKSERTLFRDKLAEQTSLLPANSKGVGPSLANAATNITAANDILAAKDFKLSGTTSDLVLPAGAEQTWPGKVAVFLGGEMGIDPGRISVDPVTDGKSGAAVFRVKVGAEELGYFKVFDRPGEVATEVSMLTKVGDLKLKEMSVVGEKGSVGVVDGSGKPKSALLMSTAEGTSVDGMIKNLPTESAQRASAMQKLRAAVKQVARGLAEMHSKMADGTKQATEQKRKDAEYITNKLDGIKDKLGDAHYRRIKALLDAAVAKYIASDVPATGYHGDANVGNFIIGNDGKLSTIDIGNMQYSFKDGKPVGTGAADIARFLESLESKRPGALTPEEVKELTTLFNETYFAQNKSASPADLEAATLLYRAELEMAVIKSASPDATSAADTTAVGAIGRLDALFGIPQGEFQPVIPPGTTSADQKKKGLPRKPELPVIGADN